MKFSGFLLTLLLFLVCIPFGARAQAPAIALVQHTSKDAGTTTSASLAFNSANTAGNWIGICVRAGRSGEIFTVTDSRGNAYHRAVQFNITVDTPNGDTLGIFYAENISGGANTITVSDSNSGTMRFAIVEYSGVATANSLDVIAMAQGNGVSPNSGSVMTASGDLLLGAIASANPANFTAGSGFSGLENVPGEPNTKLFAEQQIVATTGAESAHASLASSDFWGAALAGFKGSGAAAAVPNISSLSPSSGTVGTSVTITGTNFGTAVGTVTFNGTAASPTSWSTTRVVVPVPSGATSGNVVLTDPGVASNGVAFTVTTIDTTPPVVAITSPANNATISGTTTITATATDNVAVASVQFKVDNANTGAAVLTAPYSYALDTTTLSNANHILTALATDTSGNAATSAAVTVKVNNAPAAPAITSLNPASGLVGASVTITGANFGATQGTSAVSFNGTAGAPTSWTATSIAVPVPVGATTGNVVVTVGGAASNGVSFTVTPPGPSITSVNPASGLVGASVTITGANFGATQGTSTVSFNGTAGAPSSWTAMSIVVPVPSGATTGNVVVTVSATASNGLPFTVLTPGGPIAFVQVNSSTPQSPQTSVATRYTLAQKAGDLNVVVVGWSDSNAKASSVVDSMGNAYSLAVGPTVQAGVATQAIYYAKNIAPAAANANAVTVTFTAAANYPDVRIAEYSERMP